MATKFYDGALASGANNGSSWEDAYRTFQAAVDGCGAGDEVWGKANSETVAATVDIDNANAPNFYGGFDTSLTGTNGSVAGRDLTTNRTTLNGNNARKILEITRNCTLSGFKIYRGNGSPGGANINGTITVTISKCDFVDNVGAYQGGGLQITTVTTVNIDDCIFSNNSGAQYGSGLCINSGTPTVNVRRCAFVDNDSLYQAAAIDRRGAAILSVEDTTFTNNTVGSGGIYGTGGAVHMIGASVGLFTRCRFIDNVQANPNAWGGAVQIDGSVGGSGCIGRFINCVFTGNEAAYGGAVIVYQGTGQFTNCTFTTNNSTADGGGISAYGATTVTNCIVYGNTADGSNDEIDNGGATPTVTYSDVGGGYTGTGNVNVNPNFVGTGTNPCNLASVSNVVDSGNAGATYYPSTDILGQARVDYPGHTGTGTGTPAYSDMGAYELQAPVTASTAKLLLLFN